MDDLISRQAAIDAMLDRMDIEKHGRNAKPEEIIWTLEKLPSAQPKRGKWILNRSGAYCCSECMEPCASYVMMRPRDRFCKMCGADMRCSENPNS